MLATAVVRVSTVVRTAPLLLLALTLALLCGACAVSAPADAARAAGAAQPRLQQLGAGPDPAYEISSPGDGEGETPDGAAAHRDRRRAALAPAGPAGQPGPPAAAVPTSPRTDPPAGHRGTPDSRPRPRAATDPAVLQVFLC
ncbi:hypothetical protein ACFY7C_05880 [Streptomyces sp. NPDC012769]|uniref:hypothetical protein n=1 Tax=Streptomyces sp. NPDC012769 TaxID=3364848 RepID=UPI0036B2A8F0